MSGDSSNGQPSRPRGSALETALWALDAGLWPVPITPHDAGGAGAGKRPIGKAWGANRPTEQGLREAFGRNPDAGVGLMVGAQGGLVDIDVDDPEHAGATLERMFPDGPPDTLGSKNAEGRFHLFFRYDERLAAFRRSIIKGKVKANGEIAGNEHYLGLEVRIGSAPGETKQIQTVVPPSKMAGGKARKWIGAEIRALPESVIRDLEIHATPEPESPPRPEGRRPSGDISEVDLVERRVIPYLRKCEPAVSGSSGHDTAFKAACKVGPGFNLPEGVAFDLLWTEWNPTCQPPWSEKDLRRKVSEAYRVETRRGWLLDSGKPDRPVRPVKPPSKPGGPASKPPEKTSGPKVNEASNDPHRLARLYIDQHCSHPAGTTIVYHNGEFHRWDLAYRPVLEKEVRASIGKAAKAEFDRINLRALEKHGRAKKDRAEKEKADGVTETGKLAEPPRVEKVTNSLVGNVTLALSGLTMIDGRTTSPAWLDGEHEWPASEILPTQNALLHLPSYVAGLEKHSEPPTPKFFSPYAIDYGFDAQAPEPRLWLDFLNQVWPDDPESISALQEWFGYHLTPDVSQQKIGTLIGPRRCGKGTIIRVQTAMIGEANVCNPTLSGLGLQFGQAVLIGKLAAIITDARLSGRSDIAQVVESLLSISGEDSKTIHRKNQADWNGKLAAKFTIISNETPRLTDSSGALAGRMIMFRLTRSFYGKEDPKLFGKLLPEMPGILLWAIEGWKRLNERGYFIQPESGKTLVREMEELSSPVGRFVKDHCDVGPGLTVDCKRLFAAWRDHCREINREAVGDEPSFGRNLRSVLPDLSTKQERIPGTNDRPRVYVGIDLKTPSF
jgi:putative DNA primase/helicase